MKSKKLLPLVIIGLFSVCLVGQTAFGQTIIRRYDFDANTTWGAPTVTINANANSLLTSGNISPSRPAAATYGAASAVTTADLPGNSAASTARAVSSAVNGSDGILTLTFPAIAPAEVTGTNDLYISFRVAGYSLVAGGNTGVDNGDSIVASISLDGGTTFSQEVRVRGNSNSAWNYDNAVAEFPVYDGNNAFGVNDYQPSAGNTINDPAVPSKIILVIPDANLNTATGVVLRVALTVDRTDELMAVDDFIASIATPLAAPASVEGRVSDSSGGGIAKTSVTATSTNGRILTALTNPFGYYRFDELNAGETYIFQINSKTYNFRPQIVTVNDNLTDLNFSPIESGAELKTSPK